MRRTFASLLLLGAALMFSHCTHSTLSSPPTSTGISTADLGLYLAVEVKGNLTYKHPGWNEYMPLSFGTALYRGNLLQAASDAEGLVVCADLSLKRVPPGYDGGLPCPQEEPVLMQRESQMVEPRREIAQAVSIPYVLSPRHTFIQTGHPLLRWHSSGTGIITYTIRIWGSGLDWQTQTTITELSYLEDTPSLEPGVPYHLIVTDANGHSSEEEQATLDLSFALLPEEDILVIQSLATRVQELGLEERATHFLEAEIYAAHGLQADAIDLLKALAAKEDAPAVHQRLGDLYLKVGLYTEAQEAYEHALEGYRALGDRAGEAATLVGLGLVLWSNGDDATARERLERARGLYQTLGDADGTSQVETMLAEM